jgi:hypothetical protein
VTGLEGAVRGELVGREEILQALLDRPETPRGPGSRMDVPGRVRRCHVDPDRRAQFLEIADGRVVLDVRIAFEEGGATQRLAPTGVQPPVDEGSPALQSEKREDEQAGRGQDPAKAPAPWRPARQGRRSGRHQGILSRSQEPSGVSTLRHRPIGRSGAGQSVAAPGAATQCGRI